MEKFHKDNNTSNCVNVSYIFQVEETIIAQIRIISFHDTFCFGFPLNPKHENVIFAHISILTYSSIWYQRKTMAYQMYTIQNKTKQTQYHLTIIVFLLIHAYDA